MWHSDRLPSGPLEKTQLSSLEKSPSLAGSTGPCEVTAGSHPACWRRHMSVMTLRGSHQVRQLLSQVSPQAPHHSQPTSAGPYLPAVPEYLVVSEEAKLLLCPLLQNILPFLPPCPQANSCSSFETQLKSHLLHEAFCDFPQADGTAPPLPPFSVL